MRIYLFALLSLCLLVIGCSQPDGHNARNALDWAGTYSGVIPAADCPGIRVTLTLAADGTYTKSMVYLERQVAPYKTQGTFTWLRDGTRIVLTPDQEKYFVAEGRVFLLAPTGRRVTGPLAEHYTLQKL